MNPSFEQSIASTIISTIITAVIAIQARYSDNLLFLRKIIEKFLHLNASSPSSTPTANPGAFAKTSTTIEGATKVSSER